MSVGDLYKKNGVVIGVMIDQKQYVSLQDQANYYANWTTATSLEKSYQVQGVGGWRIPTKSEWSVIYANKAKINNALKNTGNKIADDWYWTSTIGTGNGYYAANFEDGTYWSPGSSNRVRLIHEI